MQIDRKWWIFATMEACQLMRKEITTSLALSSFWVMLKSLCDCKNLLGGSAKLHIENLLDLAISAIRAGFWLEQNRMWVSRQSVVVDSVSPSIHRNYQLFDRFLRYCLTPVHLWSSMPWLVQVSAYVIQQETQHLYIDTVWLVDHMLIK